jgi:hypothetical protein
MLHESLRVELVEERVGATLATAQGDTIPRDRLVDLGTGQTRSRDRWRLLDAPDTQGQRRPIVSRLLDEPAERRTQ